MVQTMNVESIETELDSENLLKKSKVDQNLFKRPIRSTVGNNGHTDTTIRSPLLRQDTVYADSTFRDDSFESVAAFENLDTLEDEEFEADELRTHTIRYWPRTLLEAVDAMLSILDDLGDRYNKWKYSNNGLYRFYCHKYNLMNVSSSRPYYTKILNQLSNMENMPMHLLNTHYKKMSDSAVYSSNETIDTVLCQLDEFVSCYCSKKCAFGISKHGTHVCSEFKHNGCLKWRNIGHSRYLAIDKSASGDKGSMFEKTKSLERTGSIERSNSFVRSKSMARTVAHVTGSADNTHDFDKPKADNATSKLEVVSTPHKLSESCFITEMGMYDNMVMEFFSERGIVHNFSYPYTEDEETTYIGSILRACVCHNCGKFCRCRCQRKIFRSLRGSEDSIDKSTPSVKGYSGDTQSEQDIASMERKMMEFVNEVYTGYMSKFKSEKAASPAQGPGQALGLRHSDLNTIYSHTLNTPKGKVQFLMNNIEAETEPIKTTNTGQRVDDWVSLTSMRGSKLDMSMGSVYYAHLFKGNACKVGMEEVFGIINNVPFSCVSEEQLNAYKKADWHEVYTTVWWRQDKKFQETRLLEEEASLEAYMVNVLEGLGYLGNIRYDTSFKVIGVGYYRRKSCYWRYFYVDDNLWEVFRSAVEYFILISTLPNEVFIDSRSSTWVVTSKGLQKKFPICPSLIRSYKQMVKYINAPNVSLNNQYKTSKKNAPNKVTEVEKHEEKDYGDDVFDLRRVGSNKCTVADVLGVSLKRKLVSSGDASTPRRNYVQKATTITPTIKHKLDPQMIYHGIFVSTQANSNNQGSSSSTPRRNESIGGATGGSDSTRATSGDRDAKAQGSGEATATADPKESNIDSSNDFRMNNLNIILSCYPDVYNQYNSIVKQANDLKVQVSLLLSDLNSIIFNPKQTKLNSDNSNYEINNTHKENHTGANKKDDESMDDLPMFDICYNSTNNSWSCLLEVVPCLVCPLECERNGSCLHYTQGRKLIELICKRMKPCEIKYTYHPHFNTQNRQNSQNKRAEIGVVSFSVSQYGHERARLLATQLKATYKIQALNNMLINITHNNTNPNSINELIKMKKEEAEHDKNFEMELLHNAITTQLTSMISTQSYIATGLGTSRSTQSIWPTDSNSAKPAPQLNSHPKINGGDKNNHKKIKLNPPTKSQPKQPMEHPIPIATTNSHPLDFKDCPCYQFGDILKSNQGDVHVSNIVKFHQNLNTFSRMFEIKNLLHLESKKIHFCQTHCCFVSTWSDVMDQTRVMYHKVDKFMDFRQFDSLVNKFNTGWPEAIRLHNMYSHSPDAAEGARMFAQTNKALTDSFNILLELQKAINEALIGALALAIRAVSDASQEKALLRRLLLIYRHYKHSDHTIRNSLLFSNEILFPFGALHDEATPPISDDEF